MMVPYTSIWFAGAEMHRYPTLEGNDHRADVAIVGGGLAGISAAYYLSLSGANVAVIEALTVGGVTSGNSTAHITSQHDLKYSTLKMIIGEKGAALFGKANEEAIGEIERVASAENIACDYERQDGYLYTAKKSGIRKIEEEAQTAGSFGLPCSMDMPLGKPPPGCISSLVYKNQAVFNPVKYLNGLAAKAIKNGARIFEHSRVLEISDGKVRTSEGSLTAKNIIIATHSPIINFPGAYFARAYQHRAYAIAFTGGPLPTATWNCADTGGKTYRKYKEYSIICGEDHRCGTQGDEDHYRNIEFFTQEHWPEARPAARWSAQDVITPDGVPFVGKYSEKTKRLFVATGFGKWGMTGTNIAARILRDAILGHKNEYTALYSPQRRLVPLALLSIAGQNAVVAGHYASGFLSFGRPICSHMKCRLTWNRSESTWDCPCHGSRFEKDGSVIEPPAINTLDIKRRAYSPDKNK